MGSSSIFHDDKLMPAICILGVIYFALSLYAYRRLMYLQSISFELNTRKLFVMSCFLSCILRVMTFASIVVLNFGYLSNDESFDSEDEDTFLGAAMLVLLDFPNYVIISAYMLVAVVWAEAFLQSRRHWMSDYDYRQKWLIGYLVFNTCLYSVQLCLYAMIFVPNINLGLLSSLLYGAMTVINLVLPSIWFALYVYMSVKFAGFPPSTKNATDRLWTLTKLGLVWTVTRLAWGAVSLTEVTDAWLFSSSSSLVLLSLELLLVFLIVEIVPIWISLKTNYLQALVSAEYQSSVDLSSQKQATDSGSLYRDINKGYSFDGNDDLQNIIFTGEGIDSRSSSNESASPMFGKSGSSRNSLFSRGTSNPSSNSIAESEASEQEYAPSGEHSHQNYWFSSWW